MPNITEKTSSNIFYQARCKASEHNEQLKSREGVAYMTSIDRGRLYRIEKGVINPFPEEIHLLADLYNAPELENYYCTSMCPLGCDMPKAEVENLDRISIKIFSSIRGLDKAKELLLDITADGVVSENEKPDLEAILNSLEKLEAVTQNLKIWVKKNL